MDAISNEFIVKQLLTKHSNGIREVIEYVGYNIINIKQIKRVCKNIIDVIVNMFENMNRILINFYYQGIRIYIACIMQIIVHCIIELSLTKKQKIAFNTLKDNYKENGQCIYYTNTIELFVTCFVFEDRREMWNEYYYEIHIS